MKYISTRDNWEEVNSTTTIKLGMVPKGGLFVPSSSPEISLEELKKCDDYGDVSYFIQSLFLTDFEKDNLRNIIKKSYSNNFDSLDIAPLYMLGDNTGILELWHGPTAAFKDLALQCMPHLLIYSLKAESESNNALVLVATSGDTGMAAMQGFSNLENTRIIVFYPNTGVSIIQKQQMITAKGENIKAVGVDGNFDNCQNAVKKIFQDSKLREMASRKGYLFSSANSINWGRLVPQIAYYFWAYIKIVKTGVIKWGDKINVCVPTGNFGNILASYYTYKMGLPIHRLICASNSNNILTDFINTGIYNINREFYVTSSPSMDIIISSNLERYIFDIHDADGKVVGDLYNQLKEKKSFSLSPDIHKKMKNLFYGGYATEKETMETIKRIYNTYKYTLDPHTAVGCHVLEEYRDKTGDNMPTILTSTANPYKFPTAVYKALSGKQLEDDIEASVKLKELSGMEIHPCLQDIDKKEVRHKDVIKNSMIESYVEKELEY